MQSTEWKVVHHIPGRIRLQVPGLSSGTNVSETLQRQISDLKAVKLARINELAHSIAIEYNPQVASEADFTNTVAHILQSLPQPISPQPSAQSVEVTLSPQTFGYEVIHLNDYELLQFQAIQQWQLRRPFWLITVLGRVLDVFQEVIDFLIPVAVFEKIGTACESVTANWPQDWQDLKPIAEVDDYLQLRQADLDVCDRLATEVTNHAIAEAMAEGGITGFFDIFGEVADDALILVLALRTIHRIGLCYGYAPQTPEEQIFAWAIFEAGIAQTEDQQQLAIRNLYTLHSQLSKQSLEKSTLKDSLGDDANDMLIDSAIEQGLSELTEETAGGLVPALGILMSIWADHNLVEQVSITAKHEFQLRQLLENQKIRQAAIATVAGEPADGVNSDAATH